MGKTFFLKQCNMNSGGVVHPVALYKLPMNSFVYLFLLMQEEGQILVLPLSLERNEDLFELQL
jgi:hypothetical protein